MSCEDRAGRVDFIVDFLTQRSIIFHLVEASNWRNSNFTIVALF